MVDYKKTVENLSKKYGTKDVFELAKKLNIVIKYTERPKEFPMGFFKKILRRKFIILNMTIINDEITLKMVIAHELGHAILHGSDLAFFLHDHTEYNRGRFEKEATLFAAHLLIDDSKIDPVELREYSSAQIASFFRVSEDLVKIRFNL